MLPIAAARRLLLRISPIRLEPHRQETAPRISPIRLEPHRQETAPQVSPMTIEPPEIAAQSIASETAELTASGKITGHALEGGTYAVLAYGFWGFVPIKYFGSLTCV